MRLLTTLCSLCLVVVVAVGCGAVDKMDTPDAGASDPDASTISPDASGASDAALACDVSAIGTYAPVAVVDTQVLPSATAMGNEIIRDTLQGTLKQHYLVAPVDTTHLNGQLFVWLPGSGSEPPQFKTILNVAAAAGYRSISLAYDNETSIAAICGVTGDPVCSSLANPDCEEDARLEMIYGSAVHDSPCLDVPPADAIEHRLLRLIQYLAQHAPQTGAQAFLTANNTALDWSKIAIGGWSQGGGHAGLIARDHRVARALYVSKGAGSVLCSTVADLATCDLDGSGAIDTPDEALVPAPWAHDPRLTPASREFATVHTSEDAWNYSREVFELWGMGAKADARAIDGVTSYADYGCAHVMSTAAVPACGPTDFHKSMAIDACLARDASGVPVLAPAYYYALTVPVP